MSVSTKKWCRIDEENTEQLIQPDIPCDAALAYEELYRVIAE